MRCVCCDVNLNDKESTRKLPSDTEFADMCDDCWSVTFPNPYDLYDDTYDVDDVETDDGSED